MEIILLPILQLLIAQDIELTDGSLSLKAKLLHLQTAIDHYSAKKSENCIKENLIKKCPNTYPQKLEELVPEYINEIPKISLSDTNWEGNSKNTYKYDPTPDTSILPEDIDETTTYIYNPKFGKVIFNKNADFNTINIIKNYIETADNLKDTKQKLKLYNTALYYYNKNKNIKDISENKEILSEIYKKRGFTYFDIKEYKKAINDFKNSKKLHKENEPTNTLGIAISYMELKNHKEAEKMAKKILEIKPEIKNLKIKDYQLFEIFNYSFSNNQKESIKKFFKDYLLIDLD